MNIAPGAKVGGRYTVRERAWSVGTGSVWLAFDSVLERAVLIQTFPDAAPDAVGRAVAKAAQVTHPGLCQIYDVSVDPPGIVFEHAPAGRLADRVGGALPPPAAARITCQLAAAIEALHEHGIAHGSIGPSTVAFDEEDRPKLAPAAASEDLGQGAPADAYGPVDGDPTERDRYALGAVAYRLFTGKEPSPNAPPARAAKRGVPPAVDDLLSRALARDATHRPSLQEFRRVLSPIAATDPPERSPGFFRQEASWLVPVLLVVAVATTAIFFGVRKVISPSSPKQTTQPSASASPYTVASVLDFDPPPRGSGEENHKDVGRVIDGSPSAWSTRGYTNAALGNQKAGVGLLFDLGTARPVGRIVVTTPDPGWVAEWRTADTQGAQYTDFTLAKGFTADANSTIVLSPSGTARYWLLWITRLVDSNSGSQFPFVAEVSEVTFYAR